MVIDKINQCSDSFEHCRSLSGKHWHRLILSIRIKTRLIICLVKIVSELFTLCTLKRQQSESRTSRCKWSKPEQPLGIWCTADSKREKQRLVWWEWVIEHVEVRLYQDLNAVSGYFTTVPSIPLVIFFFFPLLLLMMPLEIRRGTRTSQV